jgi:hypothetical protein
MELSTMVAMLAWREIGDRGVMLALAAGPVVGSIRCSKCEAGKRAALYLGFWVDPI